MDGGISRASEWPRRGALIPIWGAGVLASAPCRNLASGRGDGRVWDGLRVGCALCCAWGAGCKAARDSVPSRARYWAVVGTLAGREMDGERGPNGWSPRRGPDGGSAGSSGKSTGGTDQVSNVRAHQRELPGCHRHMTLGSGFKSGLQWVGDSYKGGRRSTTWQRFSGPGCSPVTLP